MMQAKLEQQLHIIGKKQLIRLLQQLVTRHPSLQSEMVSILQSFASNSDLSAEDAYSAEVEEDWNFGGNEEAVLHGFPQTIDAAPCSETVQQGLATYAARLSQETASDTLMTILSQLLDAAAYYMQRGEPHAALELFALLFDERLLERQPEAVSIYDEMVDAATYSLNVLLSEASSETALDADGTILSPILRPDTRRRWLERLFALWLKRLDAHRVTEDLPEILLDVAWNEDMLLLRSLVQNELQKQSQSEHSNILDFNHQYRIRALENFLKELPHS
jgi:hypothetical protein